MKKLLTAMLLLTCLQAGAQTDEWQRGLEALADSLTEHVRPWNVPDKEFKVERYGARADGKTVCTKAIQRTIDTCSKAGGGYVTLTQGDYVSGTIELKPGVMLRVCKGARLLGSTQLADYPERVEQLQSVMRNMHRYRLSLIYAERAENIGICGEGEIYFRGERENFPGPETIGSIEGRPFGIRMVECRDIHIKDITLRSSAAWMQNYLACQRLIVDGITVENTNSNYNCDGLDPDGCEDVIIRNCHIESHDDALCLKSASGRANERFLIENCRFYSTCNAFKFGTDTQGSFRRIVARNLLLGSITHPSANFLKRDDCSTGITLETVDGGDVEDVLIENVDIRGSRCPIFLYIGDRGRVWNREKPAPGHLCRILIQNVTGHDNRTQGSLITGIPERPIEQVTLRNVSLSMNGGGTEAMKTREVPLRTGYPDAQEYCRDGLPSYGFFLRHTRNVQLENVNVTSTATDERDCFVEAEGNVNLHINETPYYLFSYFKNNTTEGQQVCYALSRNGLDFEPLNGGRPVIASDSISRSGGIRDPHLLRTPDGWFLMVLTDMDWQRGKWSCRGIVMMRSRDLIHWQHHTVHFPERYAGNIFAEADAVWAPQTLYDPTVGKYMVYFSLHSPKDGPFPRDAVYYAYANSDFTGLENEPQPLFTYPDPTIDTDIVVVDKLTSKQVDKLDAHQKQLVNSSTNNSSTKEYHLFFNTWGADGLQRRQYTFTDLHDQSTWTLVPGRMQPNDIASEGSTAYQLADGTWLLGYDCFQAGIYQICRTEDWRTFQLLRTTKTTGAFTPRHGSIITITEQEAQQLKNHFK